MTVKELIAALSEYPPDMPVVYWSDHEDECVEVAEAVCEDGTSHVTLDHVAHDWIRGEIGDG